MSKFLPKVIAVHDISGMGKASIGTALPILSYMGCYVCPLPTAVLSTITGPFSGYQITDLTGQMKDTVEHWDTLDIEFEYIYSGYLGNHTQVDIIIEAQKKFGSCLVVDPVFGDNGQLYDNMDDDMVESMRRLVSYANIITPNLTEAQFLLGDSRGEVGEDGIKDILHRLCAMGPKVAVVTSCRIDGGLYVCAYERETDRYTKVKCEYVDEQYHGTGDIFTSVMLGAVAGGDALEKAIKRAADFITRAIKITVENNVPPREGIAYEKILKEL